MALTDLQQLYNLSLGLIGEYQLTEGTPTTDKQYELCERYYPSARDEVLNLHPWNEAIKQALVLQDASAPLFDYAFQYTIPTDCLRVLSINEDVAHWEIQGEKIVTDHIISPPEYQAGETYIAGQYLTYSDVTYLVDTGFTATTWATDSASLTSQTGDYGYIQMTYVYQITDTTKFSVRLRNAIAHKLAIKTITAITNSPQAKIALAEEFERLVMPQARSVDAQQGRLKPIFQSQWIRSRQ